MDPYLVHANSIAAVQAEQGDVCPVATILGQEVEIQPASAICGKALESGGFNLTNNLQFTVLVSELLNSDTLTDAVAVKDAMLQTEMDYLDDRYKIESVFICAGGLQLHVEANALNVR